jgi:lysophospholipase L1-like esterase
MKKEKEKTLLLGSSIIERWPINEKNIGITGLTSRELMETYSNEMYNNVKNVILYIGSNDITHNPHISTTEIYENITEFITQINKKINIIFVAILKSPKRTITQIHKIDIINRKMREFSQKHTNIHFCNLNRELSSHNNYLPDQIHLSEKGYSILSQHLLSPEIREKYL